MKAQDITLAEMLRANARNYGAQPGYVHGERVLTHAAYLARCQALADALRLTGVRSQDRVAILAMNCLEYAEVYGACELAGHIIATLNFRYTAAEALAALQDAAPEVLIFQAQYADLIDGLRADLAFQTYVCIGRAPDWAIAYEDFVATGDPAYAPPDPDPESLTHLIYTSGTTGRPKGVLHAQKPLALKAQLHAGDIDVTPFDRVLIVMPMFHVGARGLMSAGQWRGAAIHILESFRPDDYLAEIERSRITICHLAPTMVKDMLDSPRLSELDLSSIKAILYAAAPMPLPTLRKGLELLGSVFHQSYGQTEGMVSSLLRCQHRPDGDAAERQRLLSVGQPYPGTQVRLLDEQGDEVPQGAEGEIVYRGPFMFRGYWNDSVLTLATLRDGWVHSGDVGRFDEDGFLYIVDRKKDMIVSGGENIYSREVEDALLTHAEVSEVAVIGVPHARWGEAVHAVVVRMEGSRLSEEALTAHCSERLASYKKPRSIAFAEVLPKLANGKIDKKALRRPGND